MAVDSDWDSVLPSPTLWDNSRRPSSDSRSPSDHPRQPRRVQLWQYSDFFPFPQAVDVNRVIFQNAIKLCESASASKWRKYWTKNRVSINRNRRIFWREFGNFTIPRGECLSFAWSLGSWRVPGPGSEQWICRESQARPRQPVPRAEDSSIVTIPYYNFSHWVFLFYRLIKSWIW